MDNYGSGGLMVSTLDSGLSGLDFEPWLGTLCCVLGQDTTLTVPLSSQVHKWLLTNLILGLTLSWTSIPSRGGDYKYSQSFHAIQTGISSSIMGHLACMQTFLWEMLDCVQAMVEPSVNISTLPKCGFPLAEERGGGFRLHGLYKVQFLFCLTCPTHPESCNLKVVVNLFHSHFFVPL